MVYVVTHAAYSAEITEIVGVATNEERGRELASAHHDEHRDHKVTTPLEWDSHGVSHSIARGRRYSGDYQVEEFPVL